jgi:putative ABC transport system permease protein
MFRRLRFALTYALRNMRRDRQRTAFALFSIAAGVATVVALRMLGLMLTDALTSNVQAFLRGDVVVSGSARMGISVLDDGSTRVPFTSANIGQINQWAARNNVDVTYSLMELTQAAVVRSDRAGQPAFVFAYFIDPKQYPFYNIVRADEPARVLLADLFTGPDQVVVGRRLADQLGIHVGDTLRVGTASRLQMVRGIVPDASVNSFNNLFAIMFGFMFVDRAQAAQYGIAPDAADAAYLRLPPDADPQKVVGLIRAQWPRPSTGGFWRTDTAQGMLNRNRVIADTMSRFVLLLSLVALVIGGVGIINTMLVSVNRRSSEIAVLKTLGLRGRGVALLFFIEALAWGFFGSLLGLALGLLLSVVARTMGQEAFGVALPWRLYAEPLLLGMGLGMIITIFFSLLPTIVAGQVRPGLILRQNVPLARAGCLPTTISLGLLTLVTGLIVEAISGGKATLGEVFPRRMVALIPDLPLGLAGTLFIFLLLGLLIGLMWVLVWLMGRLPSFRNATLRLAVRGLTLHRGRTALSLLALIVGMTALSSTLIMARSINTLLYTSITEPLGGNVVVLPLLPLTDVAVRGRLDSAPGVTGYRDVRFASARLVAVDGDRSFMSRLTAGDDVQSEILSAQLEFLVGMNVHGNPPHGELAAGRWLTAEDAGHYRIVIPYHSELEAMGVKIGSVFTYRVNGRNQDYEVVGMVAPGIQAGFIPFSLSDSAVQAPLDVIPKSMPFDFIIANVEQASVNDAMASVGAVPGVFVFDIGVFDSILSRLMSQAAALPLLVAGLSLFAATVLIATTVSLATMERRRQIGILKALGVKRRQALNQLLIENGIVGVVGGLVSIAPTLLIIELVPSLTENLVRLPVPTDLIALMLALAVAITLLATLLTAWGASGEHPLNALRYE